MHFISSASGWLSRIAGLELRTLTGPRNNAIRQVPKIVTEEAGESQP